MVVLELRERNSIWVFMEQTPHSYTSFFGVGFEPLERWTKNM